MASDLPAPLPAKPMNAGLLLSSRDCSQIEEWRHGPTSILEALTVHQLFERRVHALPNSIAIAFGDQEISYANLNASANRLAHLLLGKGIAPESIVAICLDRSPEMVVALLATIKAGAAYLPMSPAWPARRRAQLLRDAGAAFLITEAILDPEESPDVTSILLKEPGLRQRLKEQCSLDLPGPYSSKSLAYIMYTSGSTGLPKGVLVTHQGIVRLFAKDSPWSIAAQDVVLQLAPFTFDAATFEIWGALLNGATLVIAPPQQPSLAELGQLIRWHRITTLWLTAGLFHAMVDEQLEALTTVRQVLAGGDVLSPPRVQKLLDAFPAGHTLINGYGPTENTTFTTALSLAAGASLDAPAVPIGRPISHTHVHILDPHGRPCGIDEPGELHIGGAGLARGYLNQPELTAERFIPDPFSEDPDARLYRSGDLASWNSDGTIAFHGRLDHQIKLRGYRIEPGEIETALTAHPGIAQALVLCREDHPGHRRLVAYWIPRSGAAAGVAEPSPAELRVFLSSRLPDSMIPADFLALREFPLNANGKVDRTALPPASPGAEAAAVAPPCSALEAALHELWRDVLGPRAFGIHEDFFALGGHSLAAARLAGRISRRWGVELSMACLFGAPSIAEQASLIASAAGSDPASQRGIPRAESLAVEAFAAAQVFTASFSQTRLWFLQQLEPEASAFHLPSLWHLQGEVDAAALQGALEGILERHGALRTSFYLREGELLQVVHEVQPFELVLQPLAAEATDAELDRLVQAEISRPFDLTHAPLMRALLIRRGARDHLLLLTLHHICSDGWSQSILHAELSSLYNAFLRRQPARRRAPGLRYADVAVWQRRRLEDGAADRLLSYWLDQLRDLPPLDLPTDHPRPPEIRTNGSQISFRIDPPALDGLQRLCQRQGATLQMGLLALVAILLHRYSGQEDFAIGVLTWGRADPAFESLIGFFINTLAIRIDLTEASCFEAFLDQVRATSLGAYDHQDLPFERLVEALHPERDPSRHPLVQVLLQLIDLPAPDLCLDGLTCESVPLSAEGALVDLNFHFRHGETGLEGTVIYNRDLFAEARIRRLVVHLETLLASVLEDPLGPLRRLKLLPADERQQLQSWAQGPTVPTARLPVHGLVEQQAGRDPEAVALIYGEEQLSYAQLNARSDELAVRIRQHGIDPETDTIVGLCLERSTDMIVALLAILKAGGAYLPLEPSLPPARIHQIVADADPGLILTTPPLAERFSLPRQRLLGSGSPPPGSRPEPAGSPPQALPEPMDHLAYVLYTSGSTGLPKGTCVSHAAISHRCSVYRDIWNLKAGDIVLFHSALGFDMAAREWLLPLTAGATVVLVSDAQRRDPPALISCLEKHRCTHATATPSLWQALLEEGFRPNRPMHLIAGGEALTADLAEQLLACGPTSLIHSYGPTETCLASTYSRIETPVPDRPPIGRPLPNTEVHVLDAHFQPCPIGVVGELHIGGADLARGYLNLPELTAERFIVNPVSGSPGSRLYRTGDLACWNADGTLTLHGRLDQQIKLRGFRIEPGEIEATLTSHPAVHQACVLLRADQARQPVLIAYWTPADPSRGPDGADPESERAGLRSFLAERLPEYMIPGVLQRMEAWPLTPHGKLDRAALPDPASLAAESAGQAPGTLREKQLHQLWQEVLGHGDFGVHDNFFAVGGHSLAAARLRSRIEQRLGQPLAISLLFKAQTIADLACHLGDQPEMSLRTGMETIPETETFDL